MQALSGDSVMLLLTTKAYYRAVYDTGMSSVRQVRYIH